MPEVKTYPKRILLSSPSPERVQPSASVYISIPPDAQPQTCLLPLVLLFPLQPPSSLQLNPPRRTQQTSLHPHTHTPDAFLSSRRPQRPQLRGSSQAPHVLFHPSPDTPDSVSCYLSLACIAVEHTGYFMHVSVSYPSPTLASKPRDGMDFDLPGS